MWFKQYETIRSFCKSIYTGKINIEKAEIDQTNLSENMVNFNNETRQKSKEGQAEKVPLIVQVFFLKVKKQLLMLSKVEYFQWNNSK